MMVTMYSVSTSTIFPSFRFYLTKHSIRDININLRSTHNNVFYFTAYLLYINNYEDIYCFLNIEIFSTIKRIYYTIVVLMSIYYPKRNPITGNKRINYKVN